MRPNKSEQLIIDTLLPLKEYKPHNRSLMYWMKEDKCYEELTFSYYVPDEFDEEDLPAQNAWEALNNIFKGPEKVKVPKYSAVKITIDQPIRHRVIREALGYPVLMIVSDFDAEVSRMEEELEIFKGTIND